jgi:hypothetical protein
MELFAREIVAGDFSGRVGKIFTVHVAGRQLPLKLDAFQELPRSARVGGGFRLEFLGPLDPQLAQGVFQFMFDSERFDIFVVPIRAEPAALRYEAIFY